MHIYFRSPVDTKGTVTWDFDIRIMADLLSSSSKLVEVEMKPCGEANVPVGFIFHLRVNRLIE